MNASGATVSLAQCVAMLETRRQALCAEMRDRGSPVPACDADFNVLLAEHAEVVAAITRLAPFARGEARVPHPREG